MEETNSGTMGEGWAYISSPLPSFLSGCSGVETMAYVVNILTEGVSRLWSTYIPTSPSNSRIYPHITVYTTVLASIILAAVVVSSLTNSGSNDGVKVPYKHGIPFIGSWAFFTRRIRFIEEGFRSLGSAFRFNILHVSREIRQIFIA